LEGNDDLSTLEIKRDDKDNSWFTVFWQEGETTIIRLKIISIDGHLYIDDIRFGEQTIKTYANSLSSNNSLVSNSNDTFTATTKAFFYNEPNESTIRKAYLAVGDVVNITMVQNGFGHTVFTNANGQTTEGWLRMRDLQESDNSNNENAWVLGDWEWEGNSSNKQFYLTIKQENGKLKFGYHIKTKGGCDDSDSGFEGLVSNNLVKVSLEYGPSDYPTPINITLKPVDSSTIEWEIVLGKNGDFPWKAVMKRVDNFPNGSQSQEDNENTSTTDKGVVINGIRWATRNVGAPGTFADKPEDAGMFYQWNRRTAWTTTNENVSGWDDSDASGTKWTKDNDPSPVGWRVPTEEELFSLAKAPNMWTTINGVRGRLLGTAPNQIFLPAVGNRRGSINGIYGAGSDGRYWSSNANSNYAWEFIFDSRRVDMYDGLRRNGESIRCVAE